MTTSSGPPLTPDECPLVTRRQFITGLGASVSLGVVGGYAIGLWRQDPSVSGMFTTTTSTLPAAPPGTFGGTPGSKVLVIVEMGGGNDALSMVVPHATSAYYDLRPTIGIEYPIDLDGEVGLHPNLAWLSSRYHAGQLALIEGVGYPDPDLSHFVSMETWWTAHASGPTASGWLGRYFDGTVGQDNPLAGVTIGPGPSRSMLGDSSFTVSIQDSTGLSPTAPWIDNIDELMGAWAGFAPAGIDSPGLLAPVRETIAYATQARGELASAISAATDMDLSGGSATMGGNAEMMAAQTGRRGGLASYMQLAAQLVISPVAPTVIFIHGWGDFDTHENQANRHDDMMLQLDEALCGFFGTVDAAGRANDVVVMTTSEFGRRVRDNGSGTDHGTASTSLLIGAPVLGGRYGNAVDLAALDTRGNPTHTIDFRSTYATVIDGWLEADADGVLGGDYERLPVF